MSLVAKVAWEVAKEGNVTATLVGTAGKVGALGGHYTDGSPQPLTNLDLVPVHVIIVMINTISDWILKAYFQVHIEANYFLF